MFPGSENNRREVDVIGSVRIPLGFKTESAVFLKGDAFFAGSVRCQEVGGIELHSGLGGQDFHAPSGFRIMHFGRFFQESVVIEAIIMVVAPGQLELFVRVANS